jgi:hypothetical protein
MRTLAARLRSAWDAAWFGPADEVAAAAFRATLGALCLAMYLCLTPNWEAYFAPDGVSSYALGLQGGLREPRDTVSLFYWAEGLVPLAAWNYVGMAASVLLAIGWRTRTATIILYVLQVSMVHSNRLVINGEDLVMRMALLFACFAPLGARYSIDRWLKARAGVPLPPPARVWPLRLIQVNTAMVYALSLPAKLKLDPAWLSGDALYWVLVNDTWSRFPWPTLAYAAPVSFALTWGTILAEGSFPVLVWFRRFRLPMTLALMSLHLGIAVTLRNVTFFSLAMVSCLMLFVPGRLLERTLGEGPSRLRAALKPLARRLAGASA